MVLNRKLCWIAVALGVVLGVVSSLRRIARHDNPQPQALAPTNIVLSVAATNESSVASTQAVVRVGQGAPIQKAVIAQTNAVAKSKSPRKPITNDPKIPKARQVLLANRRIVVEKGRSFPKKFCATQTPTSRATAPYVVISELPVSRDVRIQAVADGAKVLGFLPNNALLVEADAAALKNLEEDVLFMAAIEYEPTDKIQHALLDDKGEMLEVNVALMNKKDLADIYDFIAAHGGAPLGDKPSGAVNKQSSATSRSTPREDRPSITATIPRGLVGELAGKGEVKWIERYGRMKLHNDVAVKPGLMNVESVREAPLGLTGAGQIITTSDTGIDTGDWDTMHADLTNALIGAATYWRECYTNDVSGHGTHTAGSIVGDGTLSGGKIRGVAPGAKLWAWFCNSNYGLLVPEQWDWRTCSYYLLPYDLFRPTYFDACLTNAHIHSASWGGGVHGYYSEQNCWMIDAFVWLNPDFLPVFSAGNDGIGTMTIGQPATAKNVLAVGATENLRPAKGTQSDNAAQIASFSSCGPCEDNRIKPDIVAPGTYVLSCLSTKASRCGWDDGSYAHYQYMSGTSMSCPLTAGAAALVREWLARYQAKANPSAALVKAILTGGATDLFYEKNSNVLKRVPDTRQGWGRVDIAGTIAPTNGLATFLVDKLPFAATSNFTFRVTTTNAAPLNVQLVWVDYPGEAGAAKELVNDLDLRVTTATQTWLGNDGAEPDDLNNVESVRIRAAVATEYTIRVRCTAIPYDHTEGGAAALYVRGAFDPESVMCGARVGTFWVIR